MKKIILFMMMLVFTATMSFSQTTPMPVAPDQVVEAAPRTEAKVKKDRKDRKQAKKAKKKARRDKMKARKNAPAE